MTFPTWISLALAIAAGAGMACAAPARAQHHHDHHTTPADSTAHQEPADSTHHHHDAGAPPEHGHDAGSDARGSHEGHGVGMYGPYPMTREASGTAWQPDRAVHQGVHSMKGSWTLMIHGMADLIFDHQGGDRGDEKIFSANMLMGMAQRPLGPGTLGLRAMLSAEPATMGKSGYPLLLQTGETADGVMTLIDRQHPHDLFMELALAYSVSSGNRSAFLYAGLPGEPALGPPAFMHRFSGLALPEAPITHHWLDSSHITFGVLTAGAVFGGLKLEGSAFRGREPDQNRYGIESPKLDSHSFRVSLNPAPSWALQASRGRLKSPEQLEPDIDADRTTASVVYAGDWKAGHWESTIAWGRNRKRPGTELDGFLAEAAVRLHERHTLAARIERVEKDELFDEADPRHGVAYWVGKGSACYRFDFVNSGGPTLGVGVLLSLIRVPREIRDVYGRSPAGAMIFARLTL